MSKLLEQAVRDSIASGKCKIGSKEVLRSVKNSKLLVCSESLSTKAREEIEQSAKASNIPIYHFSNNSLELGRLCNKPFRVSVVSIDNSSSSNISAIFQEMNK